MEASMKPSSLGPPKVYLGGKVSKVVLPRMYRKFLKEETSPNPD